MCIGLTRKMEKKFWRGSNATKIHNDGVAFEVLPEGHNPPVGWSKVNGYLIWDLKTEFTCKARWVINRHRTLDPIGSTYARVVSRESVRIASTYAALNII